MGQPIELGIPSTLQCLSMPPCLLPCPPKVPGGIEGRIWKSCLQEYIILEPRYSGGLAKVLLGDSSSIYILIKHFVCVLQKGRRDKCAASRKGTLRKPLFGISGGFQQPCGDSRTQSKFRRKVRVFLQTKQKRTTNGCSVFYHHRCPMLQNKATWFVA